MLKRCEHVKFLIISQICLLCSYVFLTFAFQPDSSVAVGLAAIFFCFYFFEMIIVGQMGLVGSVDLKYNESDAGDIDGKEEGKYGKGILPAANFICSSLGSVFGSLLGSWVWNLGNSSPGILGVLTTALNLSIWMFYYNYRHPVNETSKDKERVQEI